MAVQNVTATFNGSQDTVAASWSATSATQAIQHGVTVTDGGGPVVVSITGRTTSGCTVNVSDRFSGTVELTIEDV